MRAWITHACGWWAISGNINENIPKPMVCAVRETEVCCWFYAEVGANALVRGNVIWVVCLVERLVSRQSVHTLDAALLEKNSSCREINIKMK